MPRKGFDTLAAAADEVRAQDRVFEHTPHRLGDGAGVHRIDQQGGVLLRTVEERPALATIDGLWVHRGVAQPGANWDRVVQDVREERIESVLRT